MIDKHTRRRLMVGRFATIAAALAMLGVQAGCEVEPILDPSKVGYAEPTPVVLPILTKLDIIDEESPDPVGITAVQREDLIPEVREYVIGTGDTLIITIFELRSLGEDEAIVRRVDELGLVRLPSRIGSVKAGGRSPSQLERDVINVLEKNDLLKNPEVSVVVSDKRQDTFSIIGEPSGGGGGTRFGTYPIPKPEFRILEAVAMAQGISGRARTLLVYRTVALTPEAAGETTTEPRIDQTPVPDEAGREPQDLLNELERSLESPSSPGAEAPDSPAGRRPPAALEMGLDAGGSPPRWVRVGDKWVKIQSPVVTKARSVNNQDVSDIITQRIIEVPYVKLLNGDMRYNVVIRPGDIIKVPSLQRGNVYIDGEIARPGSYLLPGEKDLTIKTLVASAGGFGGLAFPERVDIIRRVGDDQEAFVRINAKKIFAGEAPDVYLQPNDHVHVNSSLLAVPLAVARNGFRMTYGFGFILDRNFNLDVFGPNPN